MEKLLGEMKKFNGIFYALIAAAFWGISGVSGQFLFEQRGFNPERLVTLRLILSGMLLLFYALYRQVDIWKIWKSKTDTLQLLAFGILSITGVQVSFFKSISLSNAATANVLQFIGPLFIVLYLAFKNRQIPNKKEWLALVISSIGIFLIVCQGSLDSLALSPIALAWGLTSAVFLAIYSIQPVNLFNKHNSLAVVGWGMLIGGCFLNLFYPVSELTGTWDILTGFNLVSVIVTGGAIAFLAYGEAVKTIGAQHSSIISTAQPLTASVLAILFMNVTFGASEWTGTACIVLTIILLAFNNKESKSLKLDI